MLPVNGAHSDLFLPWNSTITEAQITMHVFGWRIRTALRAIHGQICTFRNIGVVQILTVQGESQTSMDGVVLEPVYFTNATCVKYRIYGHNGKSESNNRCSNKVSYPFLISQASSLVWTWAKIDGRHGFCRWGCWLYQHHSLGIYYSAGKSGVPGPAILRTNDTQDPIGGSVMANHSIQRTSVTSGLDPQALYSMTTYRWSGPFASAVAKWIAVIASDFSRRSSEIWCLKSVHSCYTHTSHWYVCIWCSYSNSNNETSNNSVTAVMQMAMLAGKGANCSHLSEDLK